ncbi:hypothetical protein EIN_182490 [Entamoeba invadens IP1]|uniref:hypothetical protein n=1 Tax=Entamoeba invadens IP1 TaxID=370355 RepID=UPI0002C3EF36|nr:hypothetical protein EIN_182490 [Entamoeba invadens IP1]ELP94022.1 hypothetical protein EIN_182490 [Entamoeba invadens IP1]|eukprot:XP_004260793.1 hypothetical protein EIN_182490 [Entamoeba invadens IP1]
MKFLVGLVTLLSIANALELKEIVGEFTDERRNYMISPHATYPHVFEIFKNQILYQLIEREGSVDIIDGKNNNLGNLQIVTNTSTSLVAESAKIKLTCSQTLVKIEKKRIVETLLDIHREKSHFMFDIAFYAFFIGVLAVYYFVLKNGGLSYIAGSVASHPKMN